MESIYENAGIKPETICISCEEKAKDIAKEYGEDRIEDGFHLEKGWICFPCYEQDESYANTVIFFNTNGCYDSIEGKEGGTVCRVGEYIDETNGEFRFKYHKTDGWRGYYEPESDEWTNIHSDCILSYSKDSHDLKEFDIEISEIIEQLGIPYAKVFSKTSNVFSTGYDLFVKNGDETLIEEKIEELKEKYRDIHQFTLTALTGKDEFDEKDEILVEAYRRIKFGEDFEDVKEYILERVQEVEKDDIQLQE